MKPLSLYIHIPFCIAKCGYCDFNSYALDTLLEKGHASEDWARRYADALMEEVKSRIEEFSLEGRRIETIFFGGGTPSLFPPEETKRVLDLVTASFDLDPDCEITLEANPGAAEAERFAALREAGVNRISIGVQTFDDAKRSKDSTGCTRAMTRKKHFNRSPRGGFFQRFARSHVRHPVSDNRGSRTRRRMRHRFRARAPLRL